MASLRWVDLCIIVLYMAGMALIGLRFARRQTSTERYFVAQRSIPGWAMGLSLFATLVSSVTFIAYPGSAYAGNWVEMVPGLMVIPVLMLVALTIVPFYRHVVGMSAYEYFGKRFGYPARAFASFAFSMGHFSKMAFVFYLVALTVFSMTGWDMSLITVVMGVITVFYVLIGGLEAVIWADVIQAIISIGGIFICLAFLLFRPPGGPAAALGLAWEEGKFSLGSLDWDLAQKGFWAMALYGVFWFIQKYTADQTMVQRYLVTRTDREAVKGMSFGALLCVPVWALFMLIGTLLWSFYKLTGEALPARITKPDQVFPHFLATQIPVGLTGLFMAALFAAAMSTLASDLNCLAVVGVEDFYRRLRPASSDRERLWLGRGIVGVFGVLSVAVALVLARKAETALTLYFTISSIVSGGLFGLFFLAFVSPRAHPRGVWCGIVACLLFTGYATLTAGEEPMLDLGRFNYRLHGVMIGVIGHLVLMVVGYAASRLLPGPPSRKAELTVWEWLRARKERLARPGSSAPR